jgi:hypothetical protein
MAAIDTKHTLREGLEVVSMVGTQYSFTTYKFMQRPTADIYVGNLRKSKSTKYKGDSLGADQTPLRWLQENDLGQRCISARVFLNKIVTNT